MVCKRHLCRVWYYTITPRVQSRLMRQKTQSAFGAVRRAFVPIRRPASVPLRDAAAIPSTRFFDQSEDSSRHRYAQARMRTHSRGVYRELKTLCS